MKHFVKFIGIGMIASIGLVGCMANNSQQEAMAVERDTLTEQLNTANDQLAHLKEAYAQLEDERSEEVDELLDEIDMLEDKLKVACDALSEAHTNQMVDNEQVSEVEMSLENYRVWEAYLTEDNRFGSLVMCDDNGDRRVIIYDQQQECLKELDGSIACGVKWSQDQTYYIVDRGTSPHRRGTIYDSGQHEAMMEIGYLGRTYWLSDQTLIYTKENPEIEDSMVVEIDGSTDVILHNVVTGAVEKLLVGTEEFYYMLQEVDEKQIHCTKNFFDGSEPKPVVINRDALKFE